MLIDLDFNFDCIMATVQQLMATGEEMGLDGVELKDFVKEQQAIEREERQQEREAKEKQETLRKMEMEERAKEREWREKDHERQMELKKMELEIKKVESRSEGSRGSSVHEDQDDNEEEDGGEVDLLGTERRSKIRGPKTAAFDVKDDMDSYLSRFEKYAELQEWKKDIWAIYLAALLKGPALDVYARLPSEQANDYQALLKRPCTLR